MNSTPIEFHKIWIDQCAATEGIRERFGLQDALNYLIGEKLFSFLHAAERDPLFAAEMPAFIGEIRRLFTAQEIHNYLDHLERTRYLAPQDADLEPEPDEDLEEEEDLAGKSRNGRGGTAAVLLCPRAFPGIGKWPKRDEMTIGKIASPRKSS